MSKPPRRDGIGGEMHETNVFVVYPGANWDIIRGYNDILNAALGRPGPRLEHSICQRAGKGAESKRQYSNEYKAGTIHSLLHRK